GQSADSSKSLSATGASSTWALPPVVQGLPSFLPPLQVPVDPTSAPEHCGHTWVAGVMYTSESRCTEAVTAPVWKFASLAVMLPSNRLMPQPGGAAGSGKGAPKVAPWVAPGPTAPTPVQEGWEPLSQPLRQKSRTELPPIGKLCEPPFQPLSRSPPAPRATVVSFSSLGPPAAFVGQVMGAGMVVVVVPFVPFGFRV